MTTTISSFSQMKILCGSMRIPKHPVKVFTVKTENECLNALKTIAIEANNSQGTKVRSHKVFWNVIASPFVNAINCSFQKGQLSVTQRQGVISLLPKKDRNPLFLKNWRPISLLNCDYKIASKAIGNRMQRVLPTIINNDQLKVVS